MTGNLVAREVVEDRYELHQVIGRGGFGVVWQAWDTLLHRAVAVKELRFPDLQEGLASTRLREKVLREARASARLNHPGAITVYDVIDHGSHPLIVMELVQAPTLAELVTEQGPLPPDRVAAIGLDLLDVLSAAHAAGMVHRDVKPANVMVPGTGRARLGDFGIAILEDATLTSTGGVVGSPAYMAPEQANGHGATPAADLWALAATLYFAVEGHPPFDKGSPLPTLVSIVQDPLPPPLQAGPLAPVLTGLLDKEPERRLRAATVRQQLTDVVSGRAAPAPPPVPAPGGDTLVGLPTVEATAPPPAPPARPAARTATAPPPAPPAAPRPAARTAPAPARPVRPARTAPPAPASPPPPTAREPRPPAPVPAGAAAPRSRGPVGLVLAALALLVAGALFLTTRDDGSPSASPTATSTTEAPAPEEPAPSPPSTAAPAPSGGEEVPDDGPVPADWVTYNDPATGFTISHPPSWRVRVNGTLTDFRDPATGAYLRVDHKEPPGPSPVGAWEDLEGPFASRHQGYQRIRIDPTTYAGFPAAIWEFTYRSGGAELRVVDLGFVTGRYGFALYFQARTGDWDSMQDEFDAFKASFKAPTS